MQIQSRIDSSPDFSHLTLRLAACLLTLLFSTPLWSQIEIGRLSGTVSDNTGALISKAQVYLENPLSGRQAQTSADDQGKFQFENLPYGEYVLHISASGFKSSVTQVSIRSNIIVRVAVKLPIASSSDQVTVSAPNLVEN